MKAILVVDMPENCSECSCEQNGICLAKSDAVESIDRPLWCPLKPIHALKSAGHDYIVYERQYLYKNLEREYELLKRAREFDESNISC